MKDLKSMKKSVFLTLFFIISHPLSIMGSEKDILDFPKEITCHVFSCLSPEDSLNLGDYNAVTRVCKTWNACTKKQFKALSGFGEAYSKAVQKYEPTENEREAMFHLLQGLRGAVAQLTKQAAPQVYLYYKEKHTDLDSIDPAKAAKHLGFIRAFDSLREFKEDHIKIPNTLKDSKKILFLQEDVEFFKLTRPTYIKGEYIEPFFGTDIHSQCLLKEIFSRYASLFLRDPHQPSETYDQAASLCLEKNENQKAISYYQQAIQRHKSDDRVCLWSLYNNMGVAYSHLNKWNKTIESYLKASEIVKRSSDDRKTEHLTDLYKKIGQSYFYLKDPKKGMEFYEKALNLNQAPESKNILKEIYEDTAANYSGLQDWNSASKYLELALKNSKGVETNPVYGFLAYTLSKQNKQEESHRRKTRNTLITFLKMFPSDFQEKFPADNDFFETLRPFLDKKEDQIWLKKMNDIEKKFSEVYIED